MGADTDRAAQGAVDVFSPVVTDYWRATFSGEEALPRDTSFTIAVKADLSDDRRVMVLHTDDGAVRVVLTPSLAEAVGISVSQPQPQPQPQPQARSRSRPRPRLRSEADLLRALSEVGIELHPADNLFYFSPDGLIALLEEAPRPGVRQLSAADAALFAEFQSSASEEDLDAAYVELDHWAVFGAFAQERLVAAASAYPWGNARIADLGVLTLPEHRGRGHARAVVRALSKYAAQSGYEPQYRCQLDNHASLAVANAAGLTHFGTWRVVSTESTDA